MIDPEEYARTSYYNRGYVISTFNSLEKNIEFIISDYYTGGLNYSFISVVLDRLTFESKRASLKAIFEELELKTGIFKTTGNSNPHKNLFEDIRQLSERRNDFAHFILAFPSTENNSVIGLAKNRDKIDVTFYTSEDISKIIKRIYKSVEDLTSRYKKYKDLTIE